MAEIWKQIKVLPASYAPGKLLGQFYMDIIYIFQLQHLIYHMFLAETAVQNPAKQQGSDLYHRSRRDVLRDYLQRRQGRNVP